MDIFEKFGEKVYHVGKGVSDKAKDVAAIADLKGQINTQNTIIKQNYSKIGKMYYMQNALNPEPEYEDMINEIRKSQKMIDDLQKKIDFIKDNK